MKQLEIRKFDYHGQAFYFFDIMAGGYKIGGSEPHQTKEACLQVIKDHFEGFEIVDKTETN